MEARMRIWCAMLCFVCGIWGAAEGASLDPDELAALRIFAERLGITSFWNFSVDPCFSPWNSTKGADSFLPTCGIECDCTMASCHVTKIAVVSMNAGGQIAREIGNLSYLIDINFGQNAITGTLPDEIGNLSRLQFFNVAINKLTGPLPRSFGKLTKLFTMGFGSNSFTGTLPKEIGNLEFLFKMYMDACGLGGEIPVEFAKLTKLETLWMAYNNFNGTIPTFFGNMTSLKDLKMFGNKFRGQIPASLGQLQALQSLDIGDALDGGALPPSFGLLKGLTKLSVRNCGLTGSVPDLGNLTGLTYLDLSYNNFSGSIPSAFGDFKLLQTLFLNNNNFSGELPSKLGSLGSLVRLDVSFNQLSGTLPGWLNKTNLKSNVIWNRFQVSTLDSRSSSAEMKCLQGRSSCNAVGNGKIFELAINSGGPRLAAFGSTFNEDSAVLTEGTYFSNAWAVSSSGYSDGFQTNVTTTRPVIGTTDPSLYQTARSAPTSLKYFGLGMRNGPYTLRLHFAEILIDNSSGWTGNARRIFDVHVQDTLVLSDFNIQNEAGGSLKALVKSFPLNVSDNVMKVELLWRGRGTCCHGPLISAIQLIPGFDTAGLIPKSTKKSTSSKKVAIGVGVTVGMTIFILAGVLLSLQKRKRKRRKGKTFLEEELISFEGKPNLFSYNEIKTATQSFASENKLGQGGFGAVFKGVLNDGTIVAIKQLSSSSSQGTREFLNETTVISAVQHRNLVKLHGCCIEGDNRILIYEFLENNSLHQALLGSRSSKLHLDWPSRFNICLGVARGLAYLHEDSMPRIVHRDIKASNVLLDKTLNPKIADFGLAKLFKEDHQTHVSTRVAGTIGYLAPEYAMRGQLTEKADVYSYGVLVLETVSGRTNLDMSLPAEKVYLLEWAWQLYENKAPLKLLDDEADNYNEEEVVRLIQIALLCSQAVASSRPRMSHVVAMLLGTAPVDVSSLRPGYFSALKDAAPGFFTDCGGDGTASTDGASSTRNDERSTITTDGRSTVASTSTDESRNTISTSFSHAR